MITLLWKTKLDPSTESWRIFTTEDEANKFMDNDLWKRTTKGYVLLQGSVLAHNLEGLFNG